MTHKDCLHQLLYTKGIMSKQLKSSFLFTALSLGASALNFLFYPVISHLLSARDFGDIQIGVSFIMIAAALFSSLNTLALFLSAQKESTKKNSLQHVERLVTTVSLILALLVIIFAGPIKDFLNLGDSSLLYILSVIFVLNIPAATWVGVLQGNGQFIASGWVGLTAALTKILASALFISFGWGAHGALIGMLLGFLVILPLVKILQNKSLVSFRSTMRFLSKEDLRYFSQTKTPLFILLGMVLVAIIANIDVTIAKAVLSPEEAGGYAQVSTAAKIPYFALLPVAIILFKSFIDTPKRIAKSMTLFALVALVGALATYLLRDIILGIVFGHLDTTGTLPYLAVAFSAYAVLTLAMYALIATGRLKQLLVSSVLALVLTLLAVLVQPHTSLGIAQGFCGAVVLSLLLFLPFSRQHTRKLVKS